MALDAEQLAELICTNLRDAIRDGRAECPATFWIGRPYKGGEGSATVTLGTTKITIETTSRKVIEALHDAEAEKLGERGDESANDSKGVAGEMPVAFRRPETPAWWPPCDPEDSDV